MASPRRPAKLDTAADVAEIPMPRVTHPSGRATLVASSGIQAVCLSRDYRLFQRCQVRLSPLLVQLSLKRAGR